ncbi:MAG: glucose dehydrogenase, partial [Phycisphaerae bacterium]|nr:glucose dehydrogenase [Phycisphaerae bacterium]
MRRRGARMNATAIILFVLALSAGDQATPPATSPAPTPASAPEKPLASAAPAAPAAPPASDRSVKVLPGFAWDLFACEPLVVDPVAIGIDEQGRIFVAESERQEKGVEDNRNQSYWLFDDLASVTVDDRLRMYEKWAHKRTNGMEHYRRHVDRVRVLLDPGADGKPTRAVNFSGDLRDPLDGTNAGVLSIDGDVWVTCIPALWRFRDRDGDFVADERERVFDGFGVRIALRGHDMHGLIVGPDGRLYWSIGDRGYHLTLPDGRVLADPKSGAVFRCELDGSNLELFCTGLRNPQELAFNRFGDLFTGDNNSDAGDKARIVWCVEGGETGWDMNYQTLEGANQRGPWNQERLWRLWQERDASDPLRAAWALPPLAHVSSGPSGIVAYPGLGFDAEWQDHFFLCDFLGDALASRILSFKLERDGANYSVSGVAPFVTEVLPTDVDFDYSGHMVISDWDAGWESNGRGQIYRVWDPKFVDTKPVRDLDELMRRGFKSMDDDALVTLLAHADMRVRLRAQWELARRGPDGWAGLVAAFVDGKDPMERLHGIWGLGQVMRAHRGDPKIADIGEL